jgi:hypothetical protein
MYYYIIISFIIIVRISDLELLLIRFSKLPCIERKRVAYSSYACFPAFRTIFGINSIFINPLSIAAETNVPVSNGADNSDSIAIR